jgi:chromosome segregation ATPase
MDMLKSFEEKIAYAVEKIKILKDEKTNLEKRVEELEEMMKSKDEEIDKLIIEKTAIKTRIEDLFNELESIELK